MADLCSVCDRGREACEWCHDLPEEDYAAICDCGLHDFGTHLMNCEDRWAFKWINPLGYETAYETRT